MGRVQEFVLPISLRTEESGHRRWKGGIYSGGTKYLQRTDKPNRRAPQENQYLEYNHTGNKGIWLLTGRTGTSQCSTYQFQLSSNIKNGTYDCDNKFNKSAAEDIFIDDNKSNKI